MIRVLVLGGAICAGIAGFAYAEDDVMAGFYGNTAVATGGMAETHTSYSADHSFVMKVPSYGVQFKGTWTLNGTQLCRTFDSPPPGVSNPLCTPIEAHKVGDTWKAGERTVTLVKGVQ
ncbi:MAG TPA: hypothetical protein VMU22_10645 [Rhizomicrobium sp.]|nr:hypothetical protein [Rhizomicrobium sp.]